MVRPMLSDRCPVCLPCLVCGVGVLWPNGLMDQDRIVGMEVRLSPGDLVVLDGDPAPLPKKEAEPVPNFRPIYCGRTAACIKMPFWYGARPQPRGLCVRWGHSPLPKKAAEASPKNFSAHVYCAQTAGCITMPLGMEVGLSPGDFVFDGDPKKGADPLPNFRPIFIVAKRLDELR